MHEICIANDGMTLNWCWVLYEIYVVNMIYVDESWLFMIMEFIDKIVFD